MKCTSKILSLLGLTVFAAFFTLALPSRAAAPKIGSPAPGFVLKDIIDVPYDLSKYKGKIVVLEWTSFKCPFVLGHYERGTMQALYKKYEDKVEWLAIDSNSDTNASGLYGWSMRWKISYPILMDRSGSAGQNYGAKATPHMAIIDAKGVLRYQGAIDNDPSDSKKVRINYVDEALTALLAGKKIKTPQTQAYGCGIRYMNFK
jgi:peroxiredoxin